MNLSVIPVVNTIFSIFSGNLVDLSCPTIAITSETRTGSFPEGGLAHFPANYDCKIKFEIPSGYILKYKVQTNVKKTEDKIIILDTLSSFQEFTSISSICYVPAEQAEVWIKTESSLSSFYFTWEYIDVTGYEEIQKPIEEVMSLNLTSNNYYRFKSETTDGLTSYNPIQLHTGSLSGGVHYSLRNIFVYDGDNLKSKFVGTLDGIAKFSKSFKSTGNSLTLVNFYSLPADSFVIATEYNRISRFERYNLVILSKEKVFRRKISNFLFSAITFYCIDSNETYLTDLKFDGVMNRNQEVAFTPSSPSHGTYELLTYSDPRVQRSPEYYVSNPDNRFNPQSLPQQIPTNTFTMTFLECAVDFELKSGPLEKYYQISPGREGKIIPPSSWIPVAASALGSTLTFNTSFTASEKVRFIVGPGHTYLENPGDKMIVEIRTEEDWETPETFVIDTNSQSKAVVGNVLKLTFIGNMEKSDFRLNYRVEATMSSNYTFEFSLLALPIAIFYLRC